MPVAIIGLAAVAAAGAAYAENEKAKAQKNANKATIENASQTNAANLQMFHEGRGSTGHAILPEYFGDTETQLARDTGTTYQAVTSQYSPEEQRRIAQQAIAGQEPAIAAGDQTISDLFSGGMLQQRLAEAQPVAQARTSAAAANRQAINQAQMDRIAAIQAEAARSGFAGAGTSNQKAILRATINARQAAAQQTAAAQFQNAAMNQAIQESNRNVQFQNLNLPIQRAQQQVALKFLPQDVVIDRQNRAQSLFSPYRIAPGTFQYAQLPAVQAVTPTGAIVAQGISSFAGGLGNVAASNYLAGQMNPQGASMGGSAPYGNPTPGYAGSAGGAAYYNVPVTQAPAPQATPYYDTGAYWGGV